MKIQRLQRLCWRLRRIRWRDGPGRLRTNILPPCRAWFRAFGSRAFSNGSAFCTDFYTGTALWLPPGVHADEEGLGAVIESTVAPALASEAAAIFEQMATYHPTKPHWYLPLIGVDPGHQGEGHGNILMTYALAQCDRDLAPAYLESSNPHNIPFYRRDGFEPLGAIQVSSSPTLVPMLRRPR